MKIILIITLLCISIFAQQKQYVREIPKYVVGVKSLSLFDSKKAFFVIGAYKYGLMMDTFAFRHKGNAQEYIKKYGGCVVDYETYVKMDDEAVKKHVKKHGIVIPKDMNTTKLIKKSKSDSNISSKTDIYSKEKLQRYR
ncbi:MAG: hypothetical protein L3I99_06670 [Sulfurimonas sp.]|nr:hypothetical protein [Sulfurimonas sp.]